jgi:hypothetical protein
MIEVGGDAERDTDAFSENLGVAVHCTDREYCGRIVLGA